MRVTQLALVLVLLAASALPVRAQTDATRWALVIGNEAYDSPLAGLNNPYADADRIGRALQAVGFKDQIRILHDQGRSQTLREVRELADHLKLAGPNAIGFFYYSGHGGSAVEGDHRHNYLIPVGSAVAKAEDLISEGVSLDDIIAILSEAHAKAVFVVFDACRTELPWGKGGGDPDKTFGTVASRPGLFIAFATDQGATAPDDGAFSAALAAELMRPGLPHLEAFDNAARQVAKRRSTDRLPWYSNQIYGDPIYFSGTSSIRADTSSPRPAYDARAADVAFWESCCTSGETSSENLTAYLNRVQQGDFPGLYRELARDRLSREIAVVKKRATSPPTRTSEVQRPGLTDVASAAEAGAVPPYSEADAWSEWIQSIQFAARSETIIEFLQRYPVGAHVGPARQRIEELRAQGK